MEERKGKRVKERGKEKRKRRGRRRIDMGKKEKKEEGKKMKIQVV